MNLLDSIGESLGGMFAQQAETLRTQTIEELPFEGTLWQYIPPSYDDTGAIVLDGEYILTISGYQVMLIGLAGLAAFLWAGRR